MRLHNFNVHRKAHPPSDGFLCSMILVDCGNTKGYNIQVIIIIKDKK